MAIRDEIREDMEVIGADGVHLGTVDRIDGDRIKLIRADSGEGSHKGHHHYLSIGLVAGVEGGRVRLSANADNALLFEEERDRAGSQDKAVVLVHGGFVDGSGWAAVHRRLRRAGFDVAVVQHPTLSLTGDVAAVRAAIDAQTRPVILVGHSYGGVVITEAGDDPRVAALVYIAAFAPAEGESVATLIADPAPGAPVPPIVPSPDGSLRLDRDAFAAAFAADVDPDLAEFMADSQLPWGVDALNGAVTVPAWRSKPSFCLVATDDRMIPPDAQRAMARRAGARIVEQAGSHSVYVSQPQAVVDLIETAAAEATPERVAEPADAVPAI